MVAPFVFILVMRWVWLDSNNVNVAKEKELFELCWVGLWIYRRHTHSTAVGAELYSVYFIARITLIDNNNNNNNNNKDLFKQFLHQLALHRPYNLIYNKFKI